MMKPPPAAIKWLCGGGEKVAMLAPAASGHAQSVKAEVSHRRRVASVLFTASTNASGAVF